MDPLADFLAVGIFLIQARRHRGGASLGGEGEHRHPVLIGSEANADGVARTYRLGALGLFAIDLDFSSIDRGGGQTAGLEEPRGPEPFVEAGVERCQNKICAIAIAAGVDPTYLFR